MRHKLALIMANSGLLAVVIVLLAAPLLVGQLLGSAQTGTLGLTSQRNPDQSIQVIPNITDFNQYAQFNPSPLIEPNFYQTSITLTAFANQEALYNGLITIFNPSSQPITVKVEGGKISGQVTASRLWLTLADDQTSAVTLLTETANPGATILTVADNHLFTAGQAVVGTTGLVATKLTNTELKLPTPLVKGFPVGTKVYLGAIFYNNQAQAVPDTTQTIALAPQAKAQVSLTIATDPAVAAQTQIVLPLAITTQQE